MDPSKLVNYLLEFTKRVNENLSVQHLAKGSKDFVLV
ncbi:hypothetical protein A3Q56_07964 [Intoshia linei]|uniref:Uncharacterized protein n=1 Tax=Intoshia linei TaxID=1819745 RepID=A0A177AS38_9BILA|nr:hypothetical protein A3Q56_07964 [Intoshia linei]